MKSATTDENGNRQPSTAYVLHCKNASGEVVKEDPVGYAFIWMGIITAIGLALSGVLTFVLAAPAGVLIAKLSSKLKKGHSKFAHLFQESISNLLRKFNGSVCCF